jgi:glutaredoxin-like YruB-family protein
MSKKVTIYSSPGCPACKKAKDYFNQNNVAFNDINVADNPEKAQEVFEKAGQMSVPVIDIDGQIMAGFNKGLVEKALQ